jgi:hypothetical protein
VAGLMRILWHGADFERHPLRRSCPSAMPTRMHLTTPLGLSGTPPRSSAGTPLRHPGTKS